MERNLGLNRAKSRGSLTLEEGEGVLDDIYGGDNVEWGGSRSSEARTSTHAPQ